jgi:hypothetical protein
VTNVWDGTHLFIWKSDNLENGNVPKMIEDAKNLGIAGVIIKFANGSLKGDLVSQSYMAQFKRLVSPFKAAGFKVGGWIYQYLTDVQGEVDACAEAISAGADWIVLDGEIDLKGKSAAVQQFGQLLRTKYPTYPFALSSFAIPDYHPEVPFKEYSAFVNCMMPQIYWAEMGWDVTVAFNASIAGYKKLAKPIAPTGQSYQTALPADMARFVQLVKNAGFTSVSWWDWDQASATQLAAVKANLLPLSNPPSLEPKMTKESASKVITLLGDLYNASLDPAVQAAAHYAANSLRDAVGILKQ